jgi:hypothetical protein
VQTNVVSERLVQAAIDCICSLDRASPSSTTATGLPLNGTAVNTSTSSKLSDFICVNFSWRGPFDGDSRVACCKVLHLGCALTFDPIQNRRVR